MYSIFYFIFLFLSRQLRPLSSSQLHAPPSRHRLCQPPSPAPPSLQLSHSPFDHLVVDFFHLYDSVNDNLSSSVNHISFLSSSQIQSTRPPSSSNLSFPMFSLFSASLSSADFSLLSNFLSNFFSVIYRTRRECGGKGGGRRHHGGGTMRRHRGGMMIKFKEKDLEGKL